MSNILRQLTFQPEPSHGALYRAGGERAAAFPAELIRGLHVALGEQLGETAANVLYRCGFEWSLQDMVQLNRHLHEEIGGGTDLWQMDAKFILDSWWTPMVDAGWGRATFDTSAVSRGILFVDLQYSAVAPAFPGTPHPVCHLYAGLFGGALSFFDRNERHAAEIQCVAAGAPSCKFVVAPGPEIDPVEAWRQEGIAPEEIIRRLR